VPFHSGCKLASIQFDLSIENSTASSSASFIGALWNSASASLAMAPVGATSWQRVVQSRR
jgi:hypothetical protein